MEQLPILCVFTTRLVLSLRKPPAQASFHGEAQINRIGIGFAGC
jgi:hypothetical protein